MKQKLREVEACIIKMGEVEVLMEMIDECFTGDIGEDLRPEQLEKLAHAMNLLQDQFQEKYENLKRVFYGGAEE